jgi:hypothetical protein
VSETKTIRQALAERTVMINVNRPGEVPSWRAGRLHWDDIERIARLLEAAR